MSMSHTSAELDETVAGTSYCGAFVAAPEQYCARTVNLQSFSEVNRSACCSNSGWNGHVRFMCELCSQFSTCVHESCTAPSANDGTGTGCHLPPNQMPQPLAQRSCCSLPANSTVTQKLALQGGGQCGAGSPAGGAGKAKCQARQLCGRERADRQQEHSCCRVHGGPRSNSRVSLRAPLPACYLPQAAWMVKWLFQATKSLRQGLCMLHLAPVSCSLSPGD